MGWKCSTKDRKDKTRWRCNFLNTSLVLSLNLRKTSSQVRGLSPRFLSPKFIKFSIKKKYHSFDQKTLFNSSWTSTKELSSSKKKSLALQRARKTVLIFYCFRNHFCLRGPGSAASLSSEASVSDPDWIRIKSGQWIWIRNPSRFLIHPNSDQGWQNDPQK